MSKFQRKDKTYRKVLKSRFFFIVVIILAFVSIKASIGAFSTYNQSKIRLEGVQKQHQALVDRSDSASSDLEYLQSKTGVEQEIRSRFDFAKEGEKAIFIIQEEEVEVEVPEEKRFWDKIVGVLGISND